MGDYRALCAHRRRAGIGIAELRERVAADPPLLACATDGNHGRAVARMARLFGLAAVVFVPAAMVAARRAAIAGEGAKVEVVDGTYDDAVERAAASRRAGHPGHRLAGLRDRARGG